MIRHRAEAESTGLENKKCRHVAGGFIMGTLFVHDAGRPRLDVFGVGIGSYG